MVGLVIRLPIVERKKGEGWFFEKAGVGTGAPERETHRISKSHTSWIIF